MSRERVSGGRNSICKGPKAKWEQRIHCDWSLLRERGAGEKGEKEESRDHGAVLWNSQQRAEYGVTVVFFFQSLAREPDLGWERESLCGSICFKYILSII